MKGEFCYMELERIFNTYFKKDSSTSHIIDIYNSVSDGKYRFKTLELCDVFSLGIVPDPDFPSGICFSTSLYVSREKRTDTEAIDLKMTFTQFKKNYAENNFSYEDNGGDTLIKSISEKLIENLSIFYTEKNTYTVFLDKPLTFKAKSSEDKKAADYYIIGAKLEQY